MPTEEKQKPLNLADFKKNATKIVGKDAVINAADKESYGEVIPCTSFSLRNALGIGGFAKRKIYTIDGDLSAGKSTTAYDVIAQCQKTYNNPCLLIDREDSYTTEYGKLLGVDNGQDKLTIITPHSLEQMYDVLVEAIQTNLFGVIVVDSVTAFAPECRFEGSVVMGVEARVNSDKMRLVAEALAKSNTCLILIQQTRQTIGGLGDPTTVSGGKAIPFYAHCRIRITRSVIDRENQQNVMKFTIIKNKMAPPFKVGTVIYKWNEGFDFFSEVGELAVEFGIITKKVNDKGKEGNTFLLPEAPEVKIVGKKQLMQHLTDNPEYTKAVIEPLVLAYLKDNTNLRPEDAEQNLT